MNRREKTERKEKNGHMLDQIARDGLQRHSLINDGAQQMQTADLQTTDYNG